MNVVNILGSPRKLGTSSRIARAFAETAGLFGAAVTEYHLNSLHYRGCQACEGCHTRAERCVLLDDLTNVLDDLHRADIVIFSAPIYFGDTCGQFKCFFDRMWSLVRLDGANEEGSSSRLPPGKIAVLVLSHVEENGAHGDVLDRYTMYLELHGFDVRAIVAPGVRLASDADVSQALIQAEGLARELLRGQ